MLTKLACFSWWKYSWNIPVQLVSHVCFQQRRSLLHICDSHWTLTFLTWQKYLYCCGNTCRHRVKKIIHSMIFQWPNQAFLWGSAWEQIVFLKSTLLEYVSLLELPFPHLFMAPLQNSRCIPSKYSEISDGGEKGRRRCTFSSVCDIQLRWNWSVHLE